MGTAPTWSTLNSNLYFRTASAASLDVNLASPGQQNETTSTSASGYTNSKDWADDRPRDRGAVMGTNQAASPWSSLVTPPGQAQAAGASAANGTRPAP